MVSWMGQPGRSSHASQLPRKSKVDAARLGFVNHLYLCPRIIHVRTSRRIHGYKIPQYLYHPQRLKFYHLRSGLRRRTLILLPLSEIYGRRPVLTGANAMFPRRHRRLWLLNHWRWRHRPPLPHRAARPRDVNLHRGPLFGPVAGPVCAGFVA